MKHSLGAYATQYALVALLGSSPELPFGRPAARLAPWTTVLGLSLWFWLMLLFPDGHLPSPCWGWVAWCYGLLALPGIGSLALLPGAGAWRLHRARADPEPAGMGAGS